MPSPREQVNQLKQHLFNVCKHYEADSDVAATAFAELLGDLANRLDIAHGPVEIEARLRDLNEEIRTAYYNAKFSSISKRPPAALV